MSASNAPVMHGQESTAERDSRLNEKAGREPSMEDILASIRQIIAGDQQQPSLSSRSPVIPPVVRPATAPPANFPLRATLHAKPRETVPPPMPEAIAEAPAEAMEFADIADLRLGHEAAESYAVQEPLGSAAQPEEAFVPAPAAVPPLRFARQVPTRPETPRPAAPARDISDPDLPQANEALVSPATGASVSSSFNALAASMMMQNLPPIEDIARDMLRPILKAWLDDNLPSLVERLVRAEIERVARGGR